MAERFAELTAQLTPALTPPLVAAFRGHLSDSVSRGILGREELESGDVPGSQDLAVCFADLVGFTRLGGEIELGELGSVAGRLAGLATSVAQGPVRLIKTIGDAAMFVAPRRGGARSGRADAGADGLKRPSSLSLRSRNRGRLRRRRAPAITTGTRSTSPAG